MGCGSRGARSTPRSGRMSSMPPRRARYGLTTRLFGCLSPHDRPPPCGRRLQNMPTPSSPVNICQGLPDEPAARARADGGAGCREPGTGDAGPRQRREVQEDVNTATLASLMTRFSRLVVLCPPARAVWCALRCDHGHRVLIGACDPMLCPNWGFFPFLHSGMTTSARM